MESTPSQNDFTPTLNQIPILPYSFYLPNWKLNSSKPIDNRAIASTSFLTILPTEFWQMAYMYI